MRLSLPAGSTVAVLSAERTGATDLIEALAPRLSALGLTVIEGALHAEARKSHRDHALTLLIALDPSVADEHGPDAQRRLEHIDGMLRSALIEAGVEFAVIHGQQEERVTNALRALGLGGRNDPRRIAAWDCEKCSDPVCEHRLFTDLLRERDTSGIGR